MNREQALKKARSVRKAKLARDRRRQERRIQSQERAREETHETARRERHQWLALHVARGIREAHAIRETGCGLDGRRWSA